MNPRPKALEQELLRAQTVIAANSIASSHQPKANRHALGSGSFMIHGALKALRHARTLLIDALHPSRSTLGEDGQP